jgi:rare lipoprotein A
LPFGTKLKVTNTENGKSIIVTVNDRGPYVSGRILDLTKAAARKLDFITKGKALVKIEIISSEPNTDSLFVTADTIKPFYRIESMDTGINGYSVKIASYYSETKTYEVIRALKQELNNEVFVQTVQRNNAIMYRIFAGKFSTRDEAEQVKAKLLDNHPDCYIVSLSPFKHAKVK